MKRIKIFIPCLLYLILVFVINTCDQQVPELKKEDKIDLLLGLIGTPNEFSLTPVDTSVAISLEDMKSRLINISDVIQSLKKTGIAKGNFVQAINKYSEFFRVKYWNFSIKDSGSKFLNILEVRSSLGKEDSTEKGEFEGQNDKFEVLWYKYDWICFGVDDSSQIRAVRGIYNYPPKPYVRLKSDSIIVATLEPKLLLFETSDSGFIMLSSNDIKNIVLVPSEISKEKTKQPMFEFEHEPTKIVSTHLSKDIYSKPDLISFIYDELESIYNSPSNLGSYWMTGLPGQDMISGVTYEKGMLKPGKFLVFTDSTLSIKDKNGSTKNILVADFISFFDK